MATSVGFASSVNQSTAAQGKKKRKAAAVPTTPAIRETVAKIRANNSGTKAETLPNHDDVRESWRETVIEMKLVIRDMRARAHQEAQVVAPEKPPVVFETFVQVVEETAPIKPSPLPEKVMIVDVPLLLLPAVAETLVMADLNRRVKQRIKHLFANDMPFTLKPYGYRAIELPANSAPIAGYLPALTSHNDRTVEAVKEAADATAAAEARAAIRAEYEAEHGVVLPERVAVDVGKPKFWVRNPDGTMEKRCVS